VPIQIFLLCVSIIIFPGILSIIMALQHDYNFAPKVLALRYAAALVEQLEEMFRYRACSKYYSDEQIQDAIKSDSKADKTAASQDGISAQSNAQDNMQGGSIASAVDVNKAPEEKNADLDADPQVNYDMQTARARRLTEELIKIGEKVPIFNCPEVYENEKEEEFMKLFQSSKKKRSKKPKERTVRVDVHHVIKQMKKLSGVKEMAEHT
jgi:hypothetical protein